MPELRWILLALGALFCAGLWWWETRRRRQAVEQPEAWEQPVPRMPAAAVRVEPTLGDAVPPAPPPLEDFDAEDAGTAPPPPDPAAAPAREPAPTADPVREKIVSIRLFAPPEAPFDGADLRSALEQEGLRHGEFSIFHKDDDGGARLFSVASLLEPGSFDLERMEQDVFKGVIFFALHSRGDAGVSEMRRIAQILAGRLDGTLGAER